MRREKKMFPNLIFTAPAPPIGTSERILRPRYGADAFADALFPITPAGRRISSKQRADNRFHTFRRRVSWRSVPTRAFLCRSVSDNERHGVFKHSQSRADDELDRQSPSRIRRELAIVEQPAKFRPTLRPLHLI